MYVKEVQEALQAGERRFSLYGIPVPATVKDWGLSWVTYCLQGKNWPIINQHPYVLIWCEMHLQRGVNELGVQQLVKNIYKVDEEATKDAVEKYLLQAREYKITEYIPEEPKHLKSFYTT